MIVVTLHIYSLQFGNNIRHVFYESQTCSGLLCLIPFILVPVYILWERSGDMIYTFCNGKHFYLFFCDFVDSKQNAKTT